MASNKELDQELKTIENFDRKARGDLDKIHGEIGEVGKQIELAIKAGDAAKIRQGKQMWRDLHSQLLDAAAAARKGAEGEQQRFREVFAPAYQHAEEQVLAAKLRLEELKGRHLKELQEAEQEIRQAEGEFYITEQAKGSAYAAITRLRELLDFEISQAAEHV